MGFKIGIWDQDSGSGLRILIQDQDSGSGFRVQDQGSYCIYGPIFGLVFLFYSAQFIADFLDLASSEMLELTDWSRTLADCSGFNFKRNFQTKLLQ